MLHNYTFYWHNRSYRIVEAWNGYLDDLIACFVYTLFSFLLYSLLPCVQIPLAGLLSKAKTGSPRADYNRAYGVHDPEVLHLSCAVWTGIWYIACLWPHSWFSRGVVLPCVCPCKRQTTFWRNFIPCLKDKACWAKRTFERIAHTIRYAMVSLGLSPAKRTL